MEWYVLGGSVLLLLMLFIGLGLPIPFALIMSSAPFMITMQGWSSALVSSQITIWGTWFNYVLLSVPLFVFLSELVGRSRLGPRLYEAMHHGFAVRGSAAYGSLGACAGFGAVCGSSMVGALTIGNVALPQMLQLGYGKRLASGVIASGGTLSVLIPPSLILIFYGILTDASIGKLFIAGVIPGLALTALFGVIILAWGLLRPSSVPTAGRVSWPLIRTFSALVPIAIIGFIISASIYFGVATPTEAAAVASTATIVLAFTVGGLTWRGFLEAFVATVKTMGYLGILISGAMLLSFVLNFHRVPQHLVQFINSFQFGPYAVLAVVVLFYLLLGMFLEPVSITFVTLPTMFPLIRNAGYDPIWFGIIYTLTMEIAVLTPPVGLNLYVMQQIAPDKLDVGDVILGCLPFIGAMVVLMAGLFAFPEIALWLPGAMPD
jgi:tripartite ATP-independent transporter DctM subunit